MFCGCRVAASKTAFKSIIKSALFNCRINKPEDYDGAILFVEDIPEFFDEAAVSGFFRYLGKNGILRKLNGIILGKVNENGSFSRRSQVIRE